MKHFYPPVPPDHMAELQRLDSLMRKACKTQNLVSDEDTPHLFSRHIQDSLAPLMAAEDLDLATPGQWLDFGSGAGFPLFPLAIALPSWKFVGVEPRKLRAQHLQNLGAELGLTNVRILSAKAEAIQTFPDLKGKCKVVSCRAVGSIPEDAKRAKPFLVAGGYFVTFKHDERAEAIDGYHPLSYVPYRLPGVEGLRNLVTAKAQTIQADT